MGENTLYLDFPGNEVKAIFGWDQVCDTFERVNHLRSEIEEKTTEQLSFEIAPACSPWLRNNPVHCKEKYKNSDDTI